MAAVDVGRPTPRRREEAGDSSWWTTASWTTFGVLGLILAAYVCVLVVRAADQSWTWLDGWVVCGVEVVASTLCIVQGVRRRSRRAVAFVLGSALFCWTIGDIVLTIESLGGATPPTPSWADLAYLSFYPLAYVAVVLFMRGEVRKLTTPNWLDGAIAGLGAAALCATFAFHTILKSTGGNTAATVTNLAYPIGDLLLFGLVIGGSALLSGRSKAPWILLAAGMGLNVAGDTSNLFGNSFGASHLGVILNSGAWPIAIVVMSMAVWVRQRPSNPLAMQRPPGFVLPALASLCALGILFVGTFHSIGRVALGLALVTLLTVGIRLALSVRGLQTLSHERHVQSVTDELTGLFNRRHLFRVLDAFFAEREANADGRGLAFLFVDLNHFKEINDSFGHPAGDELLRQLGDRLAGSLRDSDLLVRLGGDEFAVLLIDGGADYATTVAERLTDCLEEHFVLDVVSAGISASIGIAVAPTDANDGAGLVWCADVAMYRAKLAGLPFARYEPELDEASDPMRLMEDLRDAIDNDLLVLHYQPQLDLRTGEVMAVEALLRWRHPRLGLLPPDKFLPLAEEGGLMTPITRWVLAEAAAQCSAWREAGCPLTVSINISPTNLLEPGFVTAVAELLGEHSLSASDIVLEITETCVIAEFERAQGIIGELRDLGIIVSIDDFGSGVTSLAYLSSLAVGELKLDRSFIDGLVGVDSDRVLELVRSTIDLGHAMGLRIVAEGIEDEVTLALLLELGCDFAQGYCISVPKPAAELAFRRNRATSRPRPAPA